MQMNRELAIQMLKTRGIDGRLSGYTNGYTELYDYCLQILENYDEDCISRKAIIGKCEDTAKATSESRDTNTGFIMALDFIADYAKHLPSVESERATGRWKIYPMGGELKCSVCKTEFERCELRFRNYCPNCGAKMEVGK